MSRLERFRENPTVDMLDRLAATLSVKLGELLAALEPGARPPKTLPSGRHLKKQGGGSQRPSRPPTEPVLL
jgi:transcriptional regulator with XRE-family HTH domain